jgi:hypothetical protein
MSLLIKHQRVWRLVALFVLIVSLNGPWIYDLIHVPMPYECQLPNVRIDEIFCGTPMSIMSAIFMLVPSIPAIIQEVASGGGGPDIIIIIAIVLLVLPLFTNLNLILRGNHLRRQKTHILALGLATIFPIWFARASVGRHNQVVWGFWLYIGVVIGLILVEGLIYTARSRQD